MRSETYIKKVRVRASLSNWFLIFLFTALWAWLGLLQIVHGSEYRTAAEKIRLKTTPIAAKRGSIIDRTGRPLAVDKIWPSVYIDPTIVKNLDSESSILSKNLNVPAATIKDLIIHGKTRSVALAVNITPEIAKKIDDERSRGKLNGVVIRRETSRSYVNASLAAQVVGFINMRGQGMGIEFGCNNSLTGIPGYVRAEKDTWGYVIPGTEQDESPAIDGKDVTLTIDSEIQQRTEEALTKAFEKFHAKGAMAVVLDPKTGEVLSMVSLPSYDPNHLRTELKATPSAEWNRCIGSRFEPGSTFKLITISAAMQEGLINENSIFHCNGRMPIGKHTIHCALHHPYTHGHGACNPEKTMEVSCNISAAQIGQLVGAEKMYNYTKAFGLLDKNDLHLPGEVFGSLEDPEKWDSPRLKLATVAFGQSVAVTPLALAAAYGAIANDGVWIRPHVIQSIGGKPNTDIIRRTVVSSEVARKIREMLVTVVESGTGKAAQVEGVEIGGKTGTAQKPDPVTHVMTHSKYLSSFIGMLPASNPRAVILVMVDEPKGQFYGAAVAAPVFQEVASFLSYYWKLGSEKNLVNSDPQKLSAVQKL